jgi:hypothetical protein
VTAATTGRRGFIVTAGLAAAATLFPGRAQPGSTGGDARRSNLDEYRTAWRFAYLEVLEDLAQALKPRFEAGELYAFRDPDSKPSDYSGLKRVEDACSKHFGLGSFESGWDDDNNGTARMILAVSPHTEVTGEGGEVHPCDHAREAVAWDLIALARERGWYTPTADEFADPLLEC